jgi:anti-anti-sigma factor
VNPFHAQVRGRGGVAVVELQGQLDARADLALTTAFEEAVRTDPSAVLLAFDGVDYINSTGIALIVGLLAHARAQGLAVLVCGLSEHYQHIFEITRLADFMQFFPDEDAAVVGVTPVA